MNNIFEKKNDWHLIELFVLFLVLEKILFSILKIEFWFHGHNQGLCTCYNAFDNIVIIGHPIFKFQADFQLILFLVNWKESWNEFYCYPFYT